MKRMSKRLKRTTKQYITVCIIAVVMSGAAAAVISFRVINDVKTESERLVSEYRREMEANKQTVYIVNNDVLAGEALAESNLTKKTVYASQPASTYIDENDIGKIALVDIKSGTQALKTMVTDVYIEQDIREAEFETIMISSNILENDILDIRIVYPNGEDYTVLAKKVIKGYNAGSINCFLWLNEEELIRMQSAIVDAYLYGGTYLYTTKYVEPNLQEATVVNYEPSVEVLKLIQENPNIIETATNELSVMVRKALENRLSNSMNRDVRNNQWDIEDNFIYRDYAEPSTIEPEDDILPDEDDIIGQNEIQDSGINYSDNTNKNNEKKDDADIEDKYTVSEEDFFPELGKSKKGVDPGADLGYETYDLFGVDGKEDVLVFTEG